MQEISVKVLFFLGIFSAKPLPKMLHVCSQKFLICINKFGFMVFPSCRHFVQAKTFEKKFRILKSENPLCQKFLKNIYNLGFSLFCSFCWCSVLSKIWKRETKYTEEGSCVKSCQLTNCIRHLHIIVSRFWRKDELWKLKLVLWHDLERIKARPTKRGKS